MSKSMSKSKKKIIAIVALVIVVVGLIVAFITTSFMSNKKNEGADTEINPATQSQSETATPDEYSDASNENSVPADKDNSSDSSKNNNSANSSSGAKKDHEVETVGDDIIEHYNDNGIEGKMVYHFDGNTLASVTLELKATAKEVAENLNKIKDIYTSMGFDVVESTNKTLKLSANQQTVESLRVIHSSKEDLLATLKSQENQ